MQHIEQIEQRIARMDQYCCRACNPGILQTLPASRAGAAMLGRLVLSVFGSPPRPVAGASAQATTRARRRQNRAHPQQRLGQKAAVQFAQAAAERAAHQSPD